MMRIDMEVIRKDANRTITYEHIESTGISE